MPELPEVETIKRGLEKKIVGLTIKRIEVLNPKSFEGDADQIKGKVISKVWRRGKMLGISLQPSATSSQQKTKRLIAHSSKLMTLLFHLKMSGQLILVASDKNRELRKTTIAGGHPTKDMFGPMPDKSTRVIFDLSDSQPTPHSSMLYFNDQRKFGWIKLVDSSQLKAHSSLLKLGPEPLDKKFTWQVLKENLAYRKKTPIKVALLDQTIVAGIGNIYACETCFNAKIHPGKPVYSLQTTDYRKLRQAIIDSLNLSIAKGGSSKQHFFNEDGQKGHFLDFTYVYDRKDQPCKICQTPIKKITLGGRGTFYCPNCQI